MKTYILIFFILFFSGFSKAQVPPENRYDKLFLLEDLIDNYDVKTYTMNTMNLYGINKDITIYNCIMSKNGLILFSVLPNLWGGENWLKVDYEKIKHKIVPNKNIYSSLAENLVNKSKASNYGILKKIGEDYYVPNYCITELFGVKSYKFPFIVDKQTINLLDTKVSIKEMEKYWYEVNPKYAFPLDIRKRGGLTDSATDRYYLSKEYQIKNDTAYQFWTYAPWNVWDDYNKQRGIDRFVYIPEKGIIGGSYDFYFEFNLAGKDKIPYDRFWNNIINEKVMIAEELK
ncbi:hypothetical protein [Elizabethkingia anophelis]|uniref:hypothetical protein n=1 Tax=Elizabethkingia anophelis TaxID=1117645 RepID=UPI001F5B2D27|nr:hypothetical protein [Elizabethkingia anophelis]